MYQQSQQARADQQALQYAKLSPFEQANYAIGRGANMLGGAVGRGLGGEDPELARITMRQQIARQINPNSPESIKQGIEALAPNDPQGAMMLQREYQRLLESNALIKTREREKAAADPFQKLVESGKYTPASLADFQVSGKPADLVLYEKPEKPEKPDKTEIQKLQEYASTLPKGSPLLAEVQAIIKAKSEPKGTTITNVLPGDKALADIPAFRAGVQRTIEPQLKAVTAADNALENIQDSINTNNFASFRAAQTQFARAISGSGDLSQKELLAAGADPSLLGGTADYLARLFTSTPTLDTQEKIKKTLLAIKKVSTNKAKNEIEAQRKIAYSNPGYDKARVDQALDFSEFSAQPTGDTGGKKAVTRTLKSGKVVTVIED
jgi:hypothetical protein